MQLERLNAWLGLLGHFAVLAGLLALTIEIRSTQLDIQQQAEEAVQDREFTRQLALLDPSVRASYTKALFHPDEMELDDVFGASMYLNARINSLRGYFRSYEQGIISRERWEASLTETALFLGSEFGRKWWAFTKQDYSRGASEFVEFVDAAVVNPQVIPDDRYYRELCRHLELPKC